MADELQKKLDVRGRRQLARGALKGPLEVLIRTEDPITPEQQQEIRKAGCNTRSVAGNVLSGTIADIARLAEVARLPFVRKIELSRPMFEEGQEEAGGDADE